MTQNSLRIRVVSQQPLDQGPEGVLIATDMFGGTPSNLGHHVLEPNKVEVITGVNLPMLIKAANLREKQDLTERRALAARARQERHLGGLGSI